MNKRIFAIILISVFTFFSVSTVNAEEIKITDRDETVYAMLKGNGNIDSVYVIDRIQKEEFSEKYSSNIIKAKLLPVIINIKYYLDNVEMKSNELAGKSGEIKIAIGVKQNDSCAQSLKNKYMTQIQVPLNLEHAKITKFDGTTSVITGSTETLSYAVLPGENADYELVFKAEDFEMGSIQVALVEYSSDLSSQFGSLIDGFDTIGVKAGEMISGTNELKKGMTKLSEGAVELGKGIDVTDKGASGLVKGMKEYSYGMMQYETGLAAAVKGIDNSNVALQQINAGATPIIKGYEDLYGAAMQLNSGNSDLVVLAKKLQSSKDPEVQALCQGIIAEADGVSRITAGLSQTNQGLKSLAAGLYKFAEGMNALNQGAAALPAGFGQLKTGFDGLQVGTVKLSSGLGTLKNGTSSLVKSAVALPTNIQNLIDGQIKFRDGINRIGSEVKAGISPKKVADTVSFYDGKTKIKSLQFIMKTPEIKKAENKAAKTEAVAGKQSWIQRIWNRLMDLF